MTHSSAANQDGTDHEEKRWRKVPQSHGFCILAHTEKVPLAIPISLLQKLQEPGDRVISGLQSRRLIDFPAGSSNTRVQFIILITNQLFVVHSNSGEDLSAK